MPKKPARPLDPKRTVGKNIVLLLGDLSVNEWATKHELSQTTVNRIVRDNLDPTTAMVEKIAGAVGLKPYRLLMPDLGLNTGQPTPEEQQALLALQGPRHKMMGDKQPWNGSGSQVMLDQGKAGQEPPRKAPRKSTRGRK